MTQPIPNLLYKYRAYSDYAVASIRDHMVWFSSPDGLNDPFDENCRIDTRVAVEEQQQLKNQMFLFCMDNLSADKGVTHMFNELGLPEDLKFSWSCKEF